MLTAGKDRHSFTSPAIAGLSLGVTNMANEFTQRVALFRSEYGTTCMCGDWAERNVRYVRISEYVEIQFEPLKRDDVITKQVDALDRQEKAVMAEAEKQLTDIRRRKAELLALPAPDTES